MDEMRAILDSLMGSDRNCIASLERPSKVTFKNKDICRYYLIDFCPHDLFPNTKSDLGPCPNKHSDALREQFLADEDHAYYARKYEREFIDALQRLVDGVEQRIRKGNERILGPDESRLELDKQRKADVLKQEMAQLMKQAQEAGENGNIAEAESFTRKMTEVRCNLDRLNATSLQFLASLSAQEKSLRVCPVCGAMQSLGDAASRFESHVSGKQHVGYERIRATLANLRVKHGRSVPIEGTVAKRVGKAATEAEEGNVARGEEEAVDSIEATGSQGITRVNSRHSEASRSSSSYPHSKQKTQDCRERSGSESRLLKQHESLTHEDEFHSHRERRSSHNTRDIMENKSYKKSHKVPTSYREYSLSPSNHHYRSNREARHRRSPLQRRAWRHQPSRPIINDTRRHPSPDRHSIESVPNDYQGYSTRDHHYHKSAPISRDNYENKHQYSRYHYRDRVLSHEAELSDSEERRYKRRKYDSAIIHQESRDQKNRDHHSRETTHSDSKRHSRNHDEQCTQNDELQ